MKFRGKLFVAAIVLIAAGSGVLRAAAASAVKPLPDRPLIVGIYESPPFCTKLPDGQWTGLSVELWQTVARQLNIQYHWSEYQLNDLLRAVANGDIDVAVGPISITVDREVIMDFTHPYYVSDLAIAVPKKSTYYPWSEIAREFMTIAWFKLIVVLVIMLFVSGFLVWIFERHANHTQFGGSPRHGLSSAFWWAAVTMSTVGYGDKTPQTTGGRIVALAWMFVSVITVALVTASVTSAVVANRVFARINSPSDLGRAHVAVLNGSTSEQYALLTRIDYSLYPTVADGLKAVLKQEVDACLANEAQLRYFAHQLYRGKLDVLPFTFEREDCSLALPQSSPLRERLDQAILTEIRSEHWRQVRARYLGSGG